MITDTAVEVKELSAQVTVLRRSQQHGQSIVHRTELVDGFLSRARTASSSAMDLTERLHEPSASSPLVDTALTRLQDWARALDADLGDALQGDIFAQFQDAIEKAVRELERRATGMWQRYTAQSTPETSSEVLTALASDPRARSTVITIRRLAETIRRLRDVAVPTTGEIGEFNGAAAELRAAWATLDVAGLNDEVVAFLRAANSNEGAALSLLTPIVREWLAERKVEGHYSIRPTD